MTFKSKSAVETHRIVGGRRAYNRRRQLNAERRRAEVLRMFLQFDVPTMLRGAKAEIGRRLGVHRGTVCRDLKRLSETLRRDAQQSELQDLLHRQRFADLIDDARLRDQLRELHAKYVEDLNR